MQAAQSINFVKGNSKIILLDILLLGLIYATPVLTHLFDLPLYVIEPMRLAVFACVLFTNKSNSIIIAATLPIFSVLTSGHPLLVKALIMSAELSINVLLFFWLSGKFSNKFFAAAGSILISKIIYYTVKYLAISTGILSLGLISTSIVTQFIVLVATSGLVYLAARLNTAE